MIGQIALIFPEIALASIAIVMQVAAACFKNRSTLISTTTILAVAILVTSMMYSVTNEIGFDNSFHVNPYISHVKAIVLGLALLSIIIYCDLCRIEKENVRMEFVTLVLLSTLGVFIAISAMDFLLLFCGLELQALSGYALAAFNNQNTKSSEAGLKYFILGALMSCVMLLGISFLYGYSSSINYYNVSAILNGEYNIAMVVGAVLMLSAILFKLSAAPLHIWTPDVYEGSPVCSVSYFSVAQKFGMLILLLHILNMVIGEMSSISETMIRIVAIISMVVGALGAIMQESLKRLMAYSSILNIGYVLIGVCLGTEQGIHAAIMYMLIYAVSTIGFFACIVALFGKDSDDATFDSLRGIALHRKTLASVIAILMFSFVGIPPFAGFFGKYYLFYNAIKQGDMTLAIVGIITSVIAAFYYLKVIKYMYFKDAESEIRIIKTQSGLLFVSGLSTAFVMLLFVLVPSYIL